MTVAELYDFDGIIPAACKRVLESKGLTAFTNRETPNFQEDRPRVEIEWATGSAMKRILPISGIGAELQPESAWDGTLTFTILGPVVAASGSYSVGQIGSILRYLLVVFEDLLKGDSIETGGLLPNHDLRLQGESGSTPSFELSKDLWKMVMQVNCHLSVSTTALAEVISNPELPTT